MRYAIMMSQAGPPVNEGASPLLILLGTSFHLAGGPVACGPARSVRGASVSSRLHGLDMHPHYNADQISGRKP